MWANLKAYTLNALKNTSLSFHSKILRHFYMPGTVLDSYDA